MILQLLWNCHEWFTQLDVTRLFSFTLVLTVLQSTWLFYLTPVTPRSSGHHCTSPWYSAARSARPTPPATSTWTSWTPRRPSEAKQRHPPPRRSSRHSAAPGAPPRAAQENRRGRSGEKNPKWKRFQLVLKSVQQTRLRGAACFSPPLCLLAALIRYAACSSTEVIESSP